MKKELREWNLCVNEAAWPNEERKRMFQAVEEKAIRALRVNIEAGV